MKFTSKEINQINQRGLDEKTIQQQLSYFVQNNAQINLHAPATINDGIVQLSDAEAATFSSFFHQEKKQKSIVKFVPASGAASRMFKSLYLFLDNYDINKETINSYVNRTKSIDLFLFFVTVEKLPFHDEVFAALKKHYPEYKSMSMDQRRVLFVEFLLAKERFNFGEYPKGLLPFHNYKTFISTAFEEHLVEASKYVAVNGKASLHFTISKDHHQQFLDHFDAIKTAVETKTQTKFDITYSFQDPKTDTIAATLDNKPFKIKIHLSVFLKDGFSYIVSLLQLIRLKSFFAQIGLNHHFII